MVGDTLEGIEKVYPYTKPKVKKGQPGKKTNAAAVTILTSLAISISTGLGVNAVPLIMAVVCGSASGLMLPTSTSTLTVSMVAGYRYTDYILIGGVVTIITTVVETLMISAMYGLL